MPAPQAVPPHSDVAAVPQSFRTPLVLSLFPGIGLMDRAFEGEGFCVVRGPDLLWGGDIRRFHPPVGRFDGVIGGPPCQAFSTLANLVRAKGHEPRFGNLIPEFERCVREADPAWFLMENVALAPQPYVEGYVIYSFVLDNCTLDSGDGLGEQQERKRRFTFATKGVTPDLRRWIAPAALLLPRIAGAVTQTHVDNSAAAKGRVPAVRGTPRIREATVTSSDGAGALCVRSRTVAVTAAHSGAKGGRPKGGHLVVYKWSRMLELQGLPPEFLADAPFTVEGKRKAVANGVPLPMGRAIAKAVKAALSQSHDHD